MRPITRTKTRSPPYSPSLLYFLETTTLPQRGLRPKEAAATTPCVYTGCVAYSFGGFLHPCGSTEQRLLYVFSYPRGKNPRIYISIESICSNSFSRGRTSRRTQVIQPKTSYRNTSWWNKIIIKKKTKTNGGNKRKITFLFLLSNQPKTKKSQPHVSCKKKQRQKLNLHCRYYTVYCCTCTT